MEIYGRTLRDRVGQVLVVVLVLLAFQYYRNSIDLVSLFVVGVLVFLLMISLDVLRAWISG